MNWCLDSVISTLPNVRLLVLCGERVPLYNSFTKYLFIPIIRKVLVKIFGRMYYFLVFDLIVCSTILIRRPKEVIVWSESAYKSLQLSKFLGIKSRLYCGSAHRKLYWPHIYSVSEIEFKKKRYDRELELADMIVTESNYAKQSYKDAGFTKIQIIRTRVLNLPHFTFSPKHSLSQHIIVPSTKKNKGFLDVLTIIQRLKSDKYHFDVYGSITDDIRFVDLPNATFHGSVSHHDYLKKVAQSHFLLNLSYCDAGPRAIIEAASYGLNIISTPYGIAPELAECYSRIFLVNSVSEVMDILNNSIKLNIVDNSEWKELFYD